ncbi:DUF7560 family zinc ribbon protein [Halomicrococcus sp. NG-SE-24]
MAQQFEFNCPICRAETEVDAEVRTLLLNQGCWMCGESVDRDAFSRVVD